VLGPRDGAAGRLSVAQAFNSLTYIVAPTIGGALIFGRRAGERAVDFSSLLLPYDASCSPSWGGREPRR